MILPKVRDPRFVTIRRGGTLTDSDHQLLALWAASCAEHVLGFFELAQPEDPRPRRAIEHARAWMRGEVKMTQARTAAGHAMGAARDLRGAARHAAYARIAHQRIERAPECGDFTAGAMSSGLTAGMYWRARRNSPGRTDHKGESDVRKSCGRRGRHPGRPG